MLKTAKCKKHAKRGVLFNLIGLSRLDQALASSHGRV